MFTSWQEPIPAQKRLVTVYILYADFDEKDGKANGRLNATFLAGDVAEKGKDFQS